MCIRDSYNTKKLDITPNVKLRDHQAFSQVMRLFFQRPAEIDQRHICDFYQVLRCIVKQNSYMWPAFKVCEELLQYPRDVQSTLSILHFKPLAELRKLFGVIFSVRLEQGYKPLFDLLIPKIFQQDDSYNPVSYTHLRPH
eukprot:TRINITY_DN0_c6848_g1_i1.p1 TRINITY_DN0_c6848_g1~~TRINITY_DN0_c6848_g1_i1.p1  ORF type:complete len:140 (-),score=16.61 TRINITY_DN0_c6848_g1_i1:9-428(-)